MKITNLLEESTGVDVIYPKIRIITANKVTRNKTFYPLESIQKGINSLFIPYPIPLLKDHLTEADAVPASEVFGRAVSAEIESDGINNYLAVVFEVTDPEAIQKILSRRFLTVSIGVRTNSVKCSICGCEKSQDVCDHIKGEIYGGRECYYIIGPIEFTEVSFVNVPSDNEAQVLIKNTLNESLFTKNNTQLLKKEQTIINSIESSDTIINSQPAKTLSTSEVCVELNTEESKSPLDQQKGSPMNTPEEKMSDIKNESEVSIEELNSKVLESSNLNTELTEKLTELNVKLDEASKGLEEKETNISELTEKLNTVKESNEILKESLNSEIKKSHQALAELCAILSKVNNVRKYREKSLEEVTSLLSERTDASLLDLKNDLLEEVNFSAAGNIVISDTAVYRTESKVENPVIVDTAENKEKVYGVVGDLEENEEDTILLKLGINPEVIKKAVGL